MSTAAKEAGLEVKQLSESQKLLKRYPDNKLDKDNFTLIGGGQLSSTGSRLLSSDDAALIGRGLNERTTKKLFIQFVGLKATALNALLSPLQTNQHLEKIIFSHTEIEDQGMQPIAEFMAVNRNIRSLNLDYNCISNQGLVTLATGLKQHGQLLGLYMPFQGTRDSRGQGNYALNDQGLRALTEILASNPFLISLQVHWSSGVTASAVADFVKVLEQHKHIQNLGFIHKLGSHISEIQNILDRNAAALRLCHQSCVKGLKEFRSQQKSLLTLDPSHFILDTETKLLADQPSQSNSNLSDRHQTPLDVGIRRMVQTAEFGRTALENCHIPEAEVLNLAAELEISYCRDVESTMPVVARIAILEKILVKRGPMAPRPNDEIAKEALTLLASFHWHLAQFHFKHDQDQVKAKQHLVAAYTTGSLGLANPFTETILKFSLAHWMDPDNPFKDQKSLVGLLDVLKQEPGMSRYSEWQKLLRTECERMKLDISTFELDAEQLEKIKKYPRLRNIYLDHIPYEGSYEKVLWKTGNTVNDVWQPGELLDFGLAISQRRDATELALLECGIHDEDMVAFSQTLRNNPYLNLLNISSSRESQDPLFRGIGDKAAIALAEAITVRGKLDTLILNNNRIGDGGARALATMLAKNVEVHRLDLESNLISHEGASALLKSLSSNTHLQALDLGCGFTDMKGQEVLNMIPALLIANHTLQCLYVSVSGMSDKICTDILTELDQNKTITTLDIECFNVSSGVARFNQEKEKTLNRNTGLKLLRDSILDQIKKLAPGRKTQRRKNPDSSVTADKKQQGEQDRITDPADAFKILGQTLEKILKECEQLEKLGYYPSKVNELRYSAELAYCLHVTQRFLSATTELVDLKSLSDRACRAVGNLQIATGSEVRETALSQSAELHFDLIKNLTLRKDLAESQELRDTLKQYALCAFVSSVYGKKSESTAHIAELALAFWINHESLNMASVQQVIQNLKRHDTDDKHKDCGRYSELRNKGIKICQQLNLDPKYFEQAVLTWNEQDQKASADVKPKPSADVNPLASGSSQPVVFSNLGLQASNAAGSGAVSAAPNSEIVRGLDDDEEPEHDHRP